MIKKTKFKDLVLIDNVSFKDNRGYFRELLKEKDLNRKFPFLVMSFSKKNVIRGLHLQTKNSQKWKRCGHVVGIKIVERRCRKITLSLTLPHFYTRQCQA